MKTLQKPKKWVAVFAMIACFACSAFAQSTKPASQNYPEGGSNKTGVATATATNATPTTTTQTQPKPAQATATKPAASTLPSSASAQDCYTIEKNMLTSTEAGENFQYKIKVTALSNFEQVSLTEELPDNAAFVSAEPSASASGKNLNWNIGAMNKGDAKEFIVTIRPQAEGNYKTISKVSTQKSIEAGFFAGMPKLQILASTQETTSELEDTVTYTVNVKNVGTAPARDVVVSNILPDSLVEMSGQGQKWDVKVGDLAPNQDKTFVVKAKANRRGPAKSQATAVAANVKTPVAADVSFNVIESKLAIAKAGTERQFIFREANYTIIVKNEGDSILKNVVVTDEAPGGSRITVADGADLSKPGKATWIISSLTPGESKTFNVTVFNEKPGKIAAKATARAENGKFASAEAVTLWQGAPGLVYEISDEKDPVLVGESNVYTVKLMNQGSFETIFADVKVTFASNVVILDNNNNPNGQVIEFKQVTLKPRETIIYKINTKAVSAGIGKATLEVKSNYMTEAFSKQEPTYIY